MKHAVILFLMASHAFSDVDIDLPTGVVPNVCSDGPIGVTPIDLIITSNIFPDASKENPNFIRFNVEPSSHTKLTDSLVKIDGPPIRIALRVDASGSGQATDVRMIAPDDAISIVRWQRGEKGIWLKVQAPSSEWLEIDGHVSSPSADYAILLTIGASGDFSYLQNSNLYRNGHANSVSNHNQNQEQSSTELFVDYELAPDPSVPTQLTIDYALFNGAVGVTTSEDENHIVHGDLLCPPFASQEIVARLTTCSRLLLPWLSYSRDFHSSLFVANPHNTSVTVSFEGRRAGSMSFSSAVSVPAYGMINMNIEDVFPDLTLGAGLSVVAESDFPGLSGGWVTYGVHSVSGKSPAMGNAVNLTSYSQRGFGESLLLGQIDGTGTDSSGFVIINAGNTETDVDLLVFNSRGTLVATSLLDSCKPFVPKVFLGNEIVPETQDNVYILAKSLDEPIAGVYFRFNQSLEPSIFNASPVDFVYEPIP